MTSTTNLNVSKKLVKTRTPSIPVRQTKTSKIRSAIGNQLEFLKSNIQKLKETESATASTSSDITDSKESIKSDTFKKPINITRKSVVSRSSDVITSRTNSGLRQNVTIQSTIKSPTRNNKTLPIKATQSQAKIQKQNDCKINIINLNKTTQAISKPSITNKPSTVKIEQKINSNKTTQATSKPSITNKPSTVKILPKINFNKTTQATSKDKKINTVKDETKSTIIKHTYPSLKPTLKTRESVIKNEKKTVKIQSPLRKSISAMHLRRVSIRDPTKAIYRSFSAVNVSQTIDENETLEIPNFNTPMAKRRSVYNSTPMTMPKSKLSPWSGCWSPTAQDLKRRLSVWMEKNGKPYNSFNHLRCFGMHYLPSQEENKENVTVDVPLKDGSYEDLKIKVEETDTSEEINVAYEALQDLRKLILEGYPVDQCEAWLDVIRTRFEELEDKPEYWECMAAIEQARGYTETYYKNDGNDLCIDNLLQKFNVLNLTPSICPPTKQARRSSLNNSNIFKSTAISFSVTESSKKEDKQYLVTPIKRSTRLSTAGKLTPGIIVCSTLDELDSSVRNSMHFRSNKALKK